MVFSSSLFLFIFLPLVLLLYYSPLRQSLVWRNGILLAASLLFYAWGEPIFVYVMITAVFLNWRLVILMDRQDSTCAKKRILCLTIGLDVLLIFVFKYLAFFFNNLSLLIGSGSMLQIALPIGISFFTFQIMSYVFDVYYGNACVQTKFSHLLLYISMFPQLIAGPIVRYTTVEAEIGIRKETWDDFSEGFARFVVGLSKKVLIANYVALLAVIIGWVLFRSSSLSAAMQYLGVMLGIGGHGLSDTTFSYMMQNGKCFFVVGILASMPIIPFVQRVFCSKSPLMRKMMFVLRVCCIGMLFLICVLVVIKSGYNPFIYFNF